MGAGLGRAGAVGKRVVNEFFTFLAMGGHGLYVWLAYGIAWTALIAIGARPILSRRRFLAMHRADDERRRAAE